MSVFRQPQHEKNALHAYLDAEDEEQDETGMLDNDKNSENNNDDAEDQEVWKRFNRPSASFYLIIEAKIGGKWLK